MPSTVAIVSICFCPFLLLNNHITLQHLLVNMCFLLHPVVKSEKAGEQSLLSAEDARRLFEKLSADWLIVPCPTASRISVYVASRW